jgi:hypothetical protein
MSHHRHALAAGMLLGLAATSGPAAPRPRERVPIYGALAHYMDGAQHERLRTFVEQAQYVGREVVWLEGPIPAADVRKLMEAQTARHLAMDSAEQRRLRLVASLREHPDGRAARRRLRQMGKAP